MKFKIGDLVVCINPIIDTYTVTHRGSISTATRIDSSRDFYVKVIKTDMTEFIDKEFYVEASRFTSVSNSKLAKALYNF